MTRWSSSPVLLGLGVGLLAGPLGLRLLQPHIPEDSGLLESVSEVALLITLFCVGLRLRMPLEWRLWRLPLRLAGVQVAVTLLISAILGGLFLSLDLPQSLLLGVVLAPTDAVLASDIHAPVEGEMDTPPILLTVEGAITSGVAAPLMALMLTLMGGDTGTETALWRLLELGWSVIGALGCGWLLGTVMARWIRLLDADRQGDFLEEMIVLATAVLAYIGALALRTEGLLAVLAAGLALSHGGRVHHTLQRPPLGSRVLKLSGRVERFATVVVMVLLGALVGSVDSFLRGVLLALALLVLLRPLAVRLSVDAAVPVGTRRPLEWFGARGAACLYCLALAINHGLGAPLARELAAITLVFMVVSIVFSTVSALSLRRAHPGAVDL